MRRLSPPVLSAVLIAAFIALSAVCARVSIPMVPVPMTLQTFAVLLAGAVLGPWRGGAAVVLYLALAALGLPVLADGASGFEPFTGPTAGYLFAFPVAAVLVGAMSFRIDISRPIPGIGLMLAGHALILALGAGWLATRIGPADALAYGVAPFLVGAAVKSGMAWGAARLWPQSARLNSRKIGAVSPSRFSS